MKSGVSKEELIESLTQTLRLTRNDVENIVLVNDSTVQILFEGGGWRKVDIWGDSGIAIIRDICKAI